MKTNQLIFKDPFAGLEFDLRLPNWVVIVGLFIVAILLGILNAPVDQIYQNFQLALIIFVFSFLASFLAVSFPKFCNSFIILGLLGLAIYIIFGLGYKGAAPILLLPGIIAFFMSGLIPSVLLAIIETFLFVTAWNLGVTGFSSLTVLSLIFCLWTLEGGFWGLVFNLKILDKWIGERYEDTTRQLEEVRTSRQEFAQTTSDLLYVNRQLALMNEKLDIARQVAEAAQKAKSAFVANVSHEFRTPLNVILGVIDILLDKPQSQSEELPATIKEDLLTIQRNSEHLSALIGDILDLSQVESGRLTLHKERVDIEEIVTKGLVVVRPLLIRKNLLLKLDIPKDLPEIYCDRKRIRQVIINLLSNAARFTDKGEITIRISHDGKDVVVCVRDTGPGIAQSDISNLFQPFAQGEIQTPDGASSGLGLSISKQFVELHQGKMWVASELGQGSSFYFSLPMTPLIETPVTAFRYLNDEWIWHQRTANASIPANTIKPMVLVYDETENLAPLLERYFDDIEFIRIRENLEARQAVNNTPIQACVVNTASIQSLLPIMDEFSRYTTDAPVIGYCFPPRGERVLTVGAQDFLVKPITRARLAEAMAKLDRSFSRIMVVDDNEDQLGLIKHMLFVISPQSQVDTLSDPAHLLSVMRQQPYDLLLLDIMMPSIDGWSLLELKNVDPILKNVPVIIISGHDPDVQPRLTRYLLASIGDGIPVEQSMRYFQAVTSLLNNVGGDLV